MNIRTKNKMSQKKRESANAFAQKGIAALTEDNDETAFGFFEKAVNALESLPKEKYTFEDWRNLAQYQLYAAETYSRHFRSNESASLLLKSLANIENVVPHTADEWRHITKCQLGLAAHAMLEEERDQWNENAINSFNHITPAEQSSADWECLATIQLFKGNAQESLSDKLSYLQSALTSYEKINTIQSQNKYWISKAVIQIQLAMAYFQANFKQSSLTMLTNALNSLLEITQHRSVFYYNLVSEVYDIFCELNPSCSEWNMFNLAWDIFFSKPVDCRSSFENAYFLIFMLHPTNTPTFLGKSFLQLLQLIHQCYQDDIFPNESVQQWFLLSGNKTWFEELLKDVTERCKPPLSLINAIGQAPNFQIGVANKLLELESLVHHLQEKLEEANEKLSVYEGKSTLFSTSGSTKKRKVVEEERGEMRRELR